MRYKRLLLGEHVLAENVGEGTAANACHSFICPGCGRSWAYLEGTDLRCWGFVRHFCGACPASKLSASPGDWTRGFGPYIHIPGSFTACPVDFFPPSTTPGLFLTHPQLANREVTLWGKWMDV